MSDAAEQTLPDGTLPDGTLPDGTVERTVATTVHGHVWLRPATDAEAGAGPAPLVVGFHGYGETAPDHLRALARIDGIDAWHLLAVQGLHPFYAKGGQVVVASWMTRFDREHAIADNTAYVERAVTAAREDLAAAGHGVADGVVFTGFSQGVAMAYRAAAAMNDAVGLVALAGDVPPDVDPERLPPVLVGRGTGDAWYDDAKLEADLERLRGAGVAVEKHVFDGGHEWGESFLQVAGGFLGRLRGSL